MTITARFAGTCERCHGQILAGTTIDWRRDDQGRSHVAHVTCPAVVAPVPTHIPAPTVNVKGIVEFLTAARERGLKFPKARFLDDDHQEIRLSLASATSREPGTVHVCLQNEWIGRIRLTGELVGGAVEHYATLRTIAADPLAAAKRYGQLTGNCCFCLRPLTDTGSTEVGYGPICARRYGLPHQAQGTPQMSPLPEEV